MALKYKLWMLPCLQVIFTMACEESKPVPPPEITTVFNIEQQQISNMDLPQANDTVTIGEYMNKGNSLKLYAPDSALAQYEKAYWLSKQINFSRGIAVSLLSIGDYWYDFKNDYIQARRFYFQAMPYCKLATKENRRLLPGVFNNLGNTYYRESKFDSAIYWFEHALVISEKNIPLDTPRLVGLYMNMGAAMLTLDNSHERSFDYTYKAALLAIQYGQKKVNFADILSNMGTLFMQKGNYDSSLILYKKALQGYRNSGLRNEMQHIYTGITAVYLFQGNMSDARRYLDSAIKENPRRAESHIELQQNIGCVYYYSGEFRKAIPYYEKAMRLAYKGGQRSKLLVSYGVLAALYDTIGEGHQAYIYHKKLTALKDEFLNEGKVKSINQTEVKYRTAAKDKEILQKQFLIAQQQNRIQQQYLWIGGALLVIVLLGGLIYRRRNKATINELKAILAGEEKERMRMASELHDGIVSKLSYAKMNFDALAPIHEGDAVDAEEFREALAFLEQSIIELRTTSHNLLPSVLKKAGLASAVAIYCQKLNKITPLRIDFELHGTLPPLKEDFQLNIYRIIQELINNIIKHAGATNVDIQFAVQGKYLSLSVVDNGIGIPSPNLHTENGIGLYNLQNRLKILNGQMSIVTERGTSISLKFDLKQHSTKPK